MKDFHDDVMDKTKEATKEADGVMVAICHDGHTGVDVRGTGEHLLFMLAASVAHVFETMFGANPIDMGLDPVSSFGMLIEAYLEATGPEAPEEEGLPISIPRGIMLP